VIPALAAAVIWTGSSWCSARGARHLGGVSANLIRLLPALPMIIAAALLFGQSTPWSLSAPGAMWFMLSGVVGMGLCDILLLNAFARLGPRVPALVTNGISAPVAAGLALWWFGERLSLAEVACIGGIIAGMVVALWPRRGEARIDAVGIASALGSAVLFGTATTISRFGYTEAEAAGTPMHWLDATVLRLMGGLAITAIVWALVSPWKHLRDGPGRWRSAMPWLLLNAILGPSLGLACYQWALASTQAGVVQAITGIIPAMVMVVAWATREDRPTPRAVVGTVGSVAAVMALALVHHR
jgi:drug/metabolite transporter (DMT)-like permease